MTVGSIWGKDLFVFSYRRLAIIIDRALFVSWLARHRSRFIFSSFICRSTAWAHGSDFHPRWLLTYWSTEATIVETVVRDGGGHSGTGNVGKTQALVVDETYGSFSETVANVHINNDRKAELQKQAVSDCHPGWPYKRRMFSIGIEVRHSGYTRRHVRLPRAVGNIDGLPYHWTIPCGFFSLQINYSSGSSDISGSSSDGNSSSKIIRTRRWPTFLWILPSLRITARYLPLRRCAGPLIANLIVRLSGWRRLYVLLPPPPPPLHLSSLPMAKTRCT